jgi:hypothetical protein
MFWRFSPSLEEHFCFEVFHILEYCSPEVSFSLVLGGEFGPLIEDTFCETCLIMLLTSISYLTLSFKLLNILLESLNNFDFKSFFIILPSFTYWDGCSEPDHEIVTFETFRMDLSAFTEKSTILFVKYSNKFPSLKWFSQELTKASINRLNHLWLHHMLLS